MKKNLLTALNLLNMIHGFLLTKVLLFTPLKYPKKHKSPNLNSNNKHLQLPTVQQTTDSQSQTFTCIHYFSFNKDFSLFAKKILYATLYRQ